MSQSGNDNGRESLKIQLASTMCVWMDSGEIDENDTIPCKACLAVAELTVDKTLELLYLPESDWE